MCACVREDEGEGERDIERGGAEEGKRMGSKQIQFNSSGSHAVFLAYYLNILHLPKEILISLDWS